MTIEANAREQSLHELLATHEPDWLVELDEDDFFVGSEDGARGGGLFHGDSAASRKMAAALLESVNASIEVDANRFVSRPIEGDRGSLRRLVTERFGAETMVAVVSARQNVGTEGATHKPRGRFFPVRVAARVRQHRILLHRLFAELKLIDEAVHVHQLVPAPIGSAAPDAARERPLYMAAFDGYGTGTPRPFPEWLTDYPFVEVHPVGPTEIQAGSLENFHVVVFPGGEALEQWPALGERGRLAVREFVRSGGGYIGICAGAYMAAQHPRYRWGLSLIDADILDHDHYARGTGYVKTELTAEGRTLFGEDRKGLLDLHYGNGPLFQPAGNPEIPDYVPLAIYRTGIGRGAANPQTMVDTPSIIGGDFGKGRVVASSGHTGWSSGLEDFFPRFVLWAARRDGVLRSGSRSGTAPTAGTVSRSPAGKTVFVDGRGGKPQRHASLSAALRSLDRGDGSPDAIHVTADRIVEIESLQIDFRDGRSDPLTIRGAASGGKPPVIAFRELRSAYAVEIAAARDARLEISNLTLTPAFAGEGVVDFPHGAILIDDERTAGLAGERLSGARITLNRIVVTSSLANDVPADPDRRIYRYTSHTRWSGPEGGGYASFDLAGSSGEASDCEIAMNGCRSAHTSQLGVVLRNPRGVRVTLHDCAARFGEETGVKAVGSFGGVTLRSCASTWNRGLGFQVVDCGGTLELVDCMMSNNRGRGVEIGRGSGSIPSRITIRGGSFSENGYWDHELSPSYVYGLLIWGGTPTLLDIRGTSPAPTLFLRNAGRGIRIDNPRAQIDRLEHIIIAGRARFAGLNLVNLDFSNGPVISRCVFAGNASEAFHRGQLSIAAPNSKPATLSLRDCTFYNVIGEGYAHVAVNSEGETATKNLTLDFQRCIFAGGSANRGRDEVALELDGVDCHARFSDCAFVTEGPHAISREYVVTNSSGHGNEVTEEDCIHADPIFAPSSYARLDAAALAGDGDFLQPRSAAYRSGLTPGRVTIGGHSTTVGEGAVPTRPTRVAIYADLGVGELSIRQTERILGGSTDMTFERVKAADIWKGRLGEFDVLMVPGGSADAESRSLKTKGRRLVTGFVRDGGGFIGTCAGCYLATQSRRGHWLGVVEADRVDHRNWARGHGVVRLEITDDGRRILGIDSKLDEVEYWQGPLMAPVGKPLAGRYIPLARFASEIHENGGAVGAMKGTDAIVAGAFGEGRFVAISPHPEGVRTPLFRDDAVLRCVEWVARRDGPVRKAEPGK